MHGYALITLLLHADPAVEETLVRASQRACQLTVARADGALGECEGVSRRAWGWLGLLPGKLAPLTSRRDDGGETVKGLCALEAPWERLALQGRRLKARGLTWVELKGDSDCRLPEQPVQLDGQRWLFSPKGDGALVLSAGAKVLHFALPSDCWTGAAVGDLDGDGLPDVIVSRDGGGVVWAVLLSGNRSRDGVVRLCAMTGMPPC